MTGQQIDNILDSQREFFRTGVTLDVKWRIRQLKALKRAVRNHVSDIEEALNEDLGRTKVEAHLCDIVPTIAEINEIFHSLRRWARPECHFSGLMCFPSTITKVYKMPYGVTLLISPFNFPILLTLGVLAASLSGGNTAVIKASSKSPACTKVLKTIIEETFPEKYVAVIDGGHDVADELLGKRFDKIFYTGSPRVGRKVLAAAAENLTPVALELGGENGNWAVVRADADIKDAARKIAFIKTLNSGQICINVNQIAVAREVAPAFIEALKSEFIRQAGKRPETNPEYPRLINKAAYDRCEDLAAQWRDRIVHGGTGDKETLKFAPTVIYPVPLTDIPDFELFNPLLPVTTFEDSEVDNLLSFIEDREHPLAFYLFTGNRRWAEKTARTMQFGGGCINETCVHLMVKGVPFNGVGHSGMGSYHGEWGFREFTHPQTVLIGRRRFNLPLREHPYLGTAGKVKMAILRLFER